MTGDLLTQVTDQTGAAISGRDDHAHRSEHPDGPTDSKGCVMFAGLTPGLYSVDVSYPGYVDPNGKTRRPGRATVTTTGTAQPNNGAFRLGQAGSIAVLSRPLSGRGSQRPGGRDLVAGQHGVDPDERRLPTAPTSGPVDARAPAYTTSSLFPFASLTPPVIYTGNYTVWGGTLRRAGAARRPAPTSSP